VESLLQGYALLSREIQLKHNLVIVGVKSWSEKSRLRNRAKELGASIILLDSISETDLNKLYAQSRINVLPSFSEGLGMPLIEAWHNGCVSLGSKQTSIEEILNFEDVTFTPESIIEIHEKLYKYLVKDEVWQMEQNRILLEREKHTWEKASLEVKKRLESVMPK
jgi:glycosyltransferase involved in cell wall biosynthesis